MERYYIKYLLSNYASLRLEIKGKNITMTLPNFLIIGAAKSGTTAIYTYLRQHPDIFMSPRKELRYFSNIPGKKGDPPPGYVHQGVSTLSEYKSYFDQVTYESVIGESSPMYLYTPGTAERISKVVPNVKMLAILRNPIDRAYSAYTHALREWKEPATSFQEALELENTRIKSGWGMLWHYLRAGFYYEQLSRFYNIFDPQQICVVLYDDLQSDPTALLRHIFNFLRVDSSFTPDISYRPNVSGFPKSKLIHELMRRLFLEENFFKHTSRIFIPKRIRKKAMIKLRERNLEKRELSSEMRSSLQDVFRSDIKKLQVLIERDLSHWLA